MSKENFPSEGIKINEINKVGKISNISAKILSHSAPTYNIYKLLDRIRPFSHLYVENNGVLGLATLISVYGSAMHNAGVFDSSKPVFTEFDDFVRLELGYTNQSVDWSMMILAFVAGFPNDDVDWDNCTDAVSAKYSRETIDEFYRLLDLYRVV